MEYTKGSNGRTEYVVPIGVKTMSEKTCFDAKVGELLKEMVLGQRAKSRTEQRIAELQKEASQYTLRRKRIEEEVAENLQGWTGRDAIVKLGRHIFLITRPAVGAMSIRLADEAVINEVASGDNDETA